MIIIELTPANGVNTLQRPVRTLNGIRGEVLQDFFEEILHSDETIELDGLLVTVQTVGETIRLDQVGRSYEALPKGNNLPNIEIRKKGLSHIKGMHKRQDELQKLGLCGLGAILHATGKFNPSKGLSPERKNLDNWIIATTMLGQEINAPPSGEISLDDFTKVLALPAWKSYRIMVVTIAHSVLYSHAGIDWTLPSDRSKEDKKTIILLHHKYHYWWVEFPRSLLFTSTNLKREHDGLSCYVGCFGCLTTFPRDDFPTHFCDTPAIHQCRICKCFFGTAEGLENHIDRNDIYPPCDVCGKSKFNGSTCLQKHYETNCKPRLEHLMIDCPICKRRYDSTRNHNCTNWTPCKNCGFKWTSVEERSAHKCTIQPTRQFYEPTVKSEETIQAWNAHFFYDFETFGITIDGTNKQRHEVMAWCLQLMLPDGETEEMRENNFIEAIECKLADVLLQYPEIHSSRLDRCTSVLRVWGKRLETFLAVTERIARKDKDEIKIKPVYWAHNGSKFDVKFIYAHYKNRENLDLHGEEIESDDDQLQPLKKEKFKRTKSLLNKNVMRMSNVGSRILSLRLRNQTFKCSNAHFASALRNVPKTFGLELDIKKGEFPYGRLSHTAWHTSCIEGLPPLVEYEVDVMVDKRRTEVIKWWVEDSIKRNSRKSYISDCLSLVEDIPATIIALVDNYNPLPVIPTPWIFKDELWSYLFADVDVGAQCMEAYHQKALDLHANIEVRQTNPDLLGKFISPLQYSTLPSWALGMYRTFFLPTDIAVLGPENTKYIRNSLRGGRTDKRANFVEITPERYLAGDRMVYYDFKSLYPSVQKCSVHDTHYPTGPPRSLPLQDRRRTSNADLMAYMEGQTGFLTISTIHQKYVTHPTLPIVRDIEDGIVVENETLTNPRLLFMNENIYEETFAWPEIQEAIRCGEIEVVFLHRGTLFDKTTNVFDAYIDFFFKIKDDSEKTGPAPNEGLRSLAKLLLNSLWGKLAQRSYSRNEWISKASRADDVLSQIDKGNFLLNSISKKGQSHFWINYSKKDDYNNEYNTAPHIAAFVTAWGRIQLHRKCLEPHGQRALYCDTDSAIIYKRKDDIINFTGSKIGDLTDELPDMYVKLGGPKNLTNHYISKLIAVAPKTYCIVIKSPDSPFEAVKVTMKGFEPSYDTSKNINAETIENLVRTSYSIGVEGQDYLQTKSLLSGYRLNFIGCLNGNETPTASKSRKQLSGAYTKGTVHPHEPRLIIPYGPFLPSEETFLSFNDLNKHYP
jgi:hypothetical protein